MQNISSMLNGLKRDGYVICPTLLDEEQLSELHDSVLTIGQTNHPGHVLEAIVHFMDAICTIVLSIDLCVCQCY